MKEAVDFFNYLGEVLFADRSDWLPYVQNVGIAKGVLSAGDGLYSGWHTLFGSKRVHWHETTNQQSMDALLHLASGSGLILNGVQRSSSIYSFFIIDAAIEAYEALINYGMLYRVGDTGYYQNNINVNVGDTSYIKAKQGAEKLLFSKAMTLACCVLTKVLYPSLFLFILTAAAYLAGLYQHAKPSLKRVARITSRRRRNALEGDIMDDSFDISESEHDSVRSFEEERTDTEELSAEPDVSQRASP